MERGLLEDLCRGARIPVTKAVLVAGFPEKMEPNEIEESLDAAEILGRVKQSPPSVPVSLEVDSLAQKLQTLMVDEKRTREELILALGGSPTPAAPSLVGWAKELGNTLKDALRPVYESAPYKRLRSFSGVSPVPPGEEDYETWRDFTVPLKRKRVLECLRGLAMRIIRALKDSQPAATVQDYLTALESVYGTTDSSEDLYYRFRHTYQEPHERLSDFIRRLEDLLQQVVRKEGIPTKRIDSARLDQVLRGTRQDGLMLWRLQLRERAQNPPPFHKLIREIREVEERLLQVDAVVQPKMAGSRTTTVLGEMEDAPSVAAALRDLTREVAMMKAQGHTVPSSRGESSRRGDSQREGFYHARVSQRLQQTIRKLQGNTNRKNTRLSCAKSWIVWNRLASSYP
uniref:Paraneoplastic antigen Ma-like C-terminal domain-containing protein n=1 Tax=Chrysemys picta bellii TaxID=8478 RepID=A0A8C3PAQ0_CHRPI